MKKSTQQIEKELPYLWDGLQETNCDADVWKQVNEATEKNDRAIGPYVDMLEEATDHLANDLGISLEQAALVLFEILFTRIS